MQPRDLTTWDRKMHGLIFRTIEAYVSDSFGAERWSNLLAVADIDVASFEAMFQYDDAYLPKILSACAQTLERAEADVLEDIGTYLVTLQNHV